MVRKYNRVILKAEIARIASGTVMGQAINDWGLNMAANAGVDRVDLAAAPAMANINAAPVLSGGPA